MTFSKNQDRAKTSSPQIRTKMTFPQIRTKMTFPKNQDGTRRTKRHSPKSVENVIFQNRDKVTQRIVRHFTPMQTVLCEFVTQRDGTVRRLHQLLFQISTESDLSNNLRVPPRDYGTLVKETTGLLPKDYSKK